VIPLLGLDDSGRQPIVETGNIRSRVTTPEEVRDAIGDRGKSGGNRVRSRGVISPRPASPLDVADCARTPQPRDAPRRERT
jgi:hypothetical protein